MPCLKNIGYKFFALVILSSLQKQVYSQKLSADRLLNDSVSVVAAGGGTSSIRIGDVNRKYIILDLWATWCKPCIENHKALEELYKKHPDSLAIITICGDTYKNFSRFNRNWNTGLIKALDTGNVFFKKYNVKIVPTLLLINRETKLVRVISGGLMSEELFSGFSKGKTNLVDSIPRMIEPEEVISGYFGKPANSTTVREQKFIPNSSSFIYYRPPNEIYNYRKIYTNFSIAGVYKDCYNMTEVRVKYDYPENLDAYSCFDLNILKGDKLDAKAFMIDHLKRTHREIKAMIVERHTDSCYVLEKIKGINVTVSQFKITDEDIRGNYFNGRKTSLDKLRFFLEEQLRIPVESKVDNDTYDIEVEVHDNNISDLNKQLAIKGLRLSVKKNKIIKYLLFQKQPLE